MVSYQQATKGMPKLLFSPRSEAGALAREVRTPSSPTLSKMYDRAPPSPTLRRHFPRKSQDRSEVCVLPDPWSLGPLTLDLNLILDDAQC